MVVVVVVVIVVVAAATATARVIMSHKRTQRFSTAKTKFRHWTRFCVTMKNSMIIFLGNLAQSLKKVVTKTCAEIFCDCTRCGYEVPRMILLEAYLYTHSLQRGVTFEALPLSSYAFIPKMVSVLETFLVLVMWNNFQ